MLFLAQTLENAEIWKKLFGFCYDVWLLLFDLLWTTKLPLTDITLTYWIIFWMVVKLSVYAINGSNTSYNELGAVISSPYRSAVRSSIKGFSRAKKSINRRKFTKEANIQKQKNNNQRTKQQYLKSVKNRVNALNKKQIIRGKHNG